MSSYADRVRGGPAAPANNADAPALGSNTSNTNSQPPRHGGAWARAVAGDAAAPPPAQAAAPTLQDAAPPAAQQQRQGGGRRHRGGGGGGGGAGGGANAQQQQQNNQSNQNTQSNQTTDPPEQYEIDYYVVLDFEATCENNTRLRNQEIIELPSVIVDAKRCVVVSEFQRYVRPIHNPNLSSFCSNLTGIPQAVVNEAGTFGPVWREYCAFLAQCGLHIDQQVDVNQQPQFEMMQQQRAAAGGGAAGGGANNTQQQHRSNAHRWAFVTCGDWDLKTMLPLQLRNPRPDGQDFANVPPASPLAFTRWINLKNVVSGLLGKRITGMTQMGDELRVPMLGHHHSGIDDCRNIARILIAVLRRGLYVGWTWGGLGDEEKQLQSTERQMTAQLAQQAASGRPVPHTLYPYPEPMPQPNLAQLSQQAQAALRAQQAASAAAQGADAHRSASSQQLQQPQQQQSSSPSSVASSPSSAAVTVAPAASQFGPVVDLDAQRDNAVPLLLGGTDPASVFPNPGAMTSCSKALSNVLRHNAVKWRVPIALNGWVRVSDLQRNQRFRSYTLQQIAAVCAASDKQRFALCAPGAGAGAAATAAAAASELFIRANQGHSIEGLVIDMERITDPSAVPVAVHGTYYQPWQAIRRGGLSRMSRQHIHFATGLLGDEGVISGMRTTCDIFVYLNTRKCLEQGIPLYRSANGVILSPGLGDTGMIPVEFFEKVIDKRTGNNVLGGA